MRWIKYSISQGRNEEDTVILLEKTVGYNEANEEIAKRESYNGEYAIEDDGRPDPEVAPTQLDVIEAQVAYTAMMTDTLLEV